MNTIFCFALVALATALALNPNKNFPPFGKKSSSQTKTHNKYIDGFKGNLEFNDYQTKSSDKSFAWRLSEYKDCIIKLSTNQPADYDVALVDYHLLTDSTSYDNFRTAAKKDNSFYGSGKADTNETFVFSAPGEGQQLVFLFDNPTRLEAITVSTTDNISLLSLILPILGVVVGIAAIFAVVRFKRKKVADHTEMEKEADHTEMEKEADHTEMEKEADHTEME